MKKSLVLVGLLIVLCSFVYGFRWDLQSYTYSTQLNLTHTQPTGMYYNGTTVTYTNFDGNLYQLDCSESWNISTCAANLKTLAVDTPNGVTFGDSGTKMYLAGYIAGTNDYIEQYSCTTPYNISTCSYTQLLDTNPYGPIPESIKFRPDGTRIYFTSSDNGRILQYNCGTEWNITTCALSGYLTVVNPTGVTFNTDGSKLYVTEDSGNYIYQYNCSVPWDVTECIKDDYEISFNSRDVQPEDIFFNPSGENLYVVGNENNAIYQYDIVPTLISFNNFSDTSTSVSPKVGDNITLSADVIGDNIDTCKLQIQDNGTWYNSSTLYVNKSGISTVSFIFTVRNVSLNHSMLVNWSVWCNSSYDVDISSTQQFEGIYNNIQLNIFNEKTLELFNVSTPDEINFYLFCPTNTYITEITNNTQTIPIDCNYDKFKFVVNYAGEIYYRTYLKSDYDLNISIYLMNLDTTNALYNSFTIDDMFSLYENPSIYIKKNVEDNTVIITSDYVDIENKIGAYLIENNEYIVEVHSNNYPVKVLGQYSADLVGEKVLSLNEFTLTPPTTTNFEKNVYWYTGTQNITGDTYAFGKYIDTGNLTTSVTFYVWQDEFNSTVLYSSTLNGASTWNAEWFYNISAYNTSTIVAGFHITHPELSTHWATKIIQVYEKITLGIEQYLGGQTLNWFLTLLIGTIALMGTIKSANYLSMLLIGGASLFVIFGWYKLSWGILAIAGIVSLLSILRSGATPE